MNQNNHSSVRSLRVVQGGHDASALVPAADPRLPNNSSGAVLSDETDLDDLLIAILGADSELDNEHWRRSVAKRQELALGEEMDRRGTAC